MAVKTTRKLLSLCLALALFGLCACAASPGTSSATAPPADIGESQAGKEPNATGKELVIGYYGQAAEYMDLYPEDYDLANTDYGIERVSYDADEAGQKRLILDLSSGKLDLVVCDGQIETTTGFADLYTFLDADPELSRADFPAWLLAGLEERGRLNQLWGSFVVNTLKAKGALAREPSPLTLENCEAYIEANELDSPLFDSYTTKELLLDYLAPPIMREAFDVERGSFSFKSEHIISLMELCNTLPESFDWELAMQEDDVRSSDVLEWVSLGGTSSIEDKELESRAPCRYFAADENLTYVTCTPKCCYMIPENSAAKEAAWDYLRTLLLPDWQVKYYETRRFGLPGNLSAREKVLNTYAADETVEAVNALLENAAVHGGENRILCGMFTAGMQSYFHGDTDLDTALGMAESKLNIRRAEQQS